MIGESTHANAILDRIIHGEIKLELKGKSMCKKLNSLTDADHSSYICCALLAEKRVIAFNVIDRSVLCYYA